MQTSPPFPPGNRNGAQPGREFVARLQQSAIFREFQQAFQVTTRLPLMLREAGSFQPPMHGSKRLNPFCALMAGANKSCSACLQLQQRIEDGAGDQPKTLECFAGLNESAVPIRAGDRVLAYLQTGQVLWQKPSRERFKKAFRQLAPAASAFDSRRLETAYFQTRVIARKQYNSVIRLLSIFAQHLSSVSNQLMVQETAAEPPAIAKARAFIAAHQDEEISLAQAARAVNMSAFYFCKVFKKATGLTFTDYLARVRIEKVKQLLLNPHMRASEAAFEAGFQSLSQFNRVFRRIVGESPSAYRDRLHGPTASSAGNSAIADAA